MEVQWRFLKEFPLQALMGNLGDGTEKPEGLSARFHAAQISTAELLLLALTHTHTLADMNFQQHFRHPLHFLTSYSTCGM